MPSPDTKPTELRAGDRLEFQLDAADGVKLSAVLHVAKGGKKRPVVLLFHQARSNAGEYDEIVPRLLAAGMNALTLDQRSGGRMWGRDNATVVAEGRSTDYLDAYPDLEAALAWARAEGFTRVGAWGSSYSAALVFRLAAEHGPELDAIVAFSPGEYFGTKNLVGSWAARVSCPVFVTGAPGREVEVARGLAARVPGGAARVYAPDKGVHGSSMLIEAKNPGGTEAA